MNFHSGRFVVPVIFFTAVLSFFGDLRAEDAGMKSFQKMTVLLGGYKDSVYTITLKNVIGGKMRPEETISVKSAGDGRLYMKWIGKVREGREIILRPGWNNNQSLVKEGGALSFSSVSLALNDPMIKRDYQRSIDFFSWRKILVELENYRRSASPVTESAGKLVFDLAGQEKMTLVIADNAAPREIEFFDKTGALQESYAFSDVKFNVGLAAADFDYANPAYGFPGYSDMGIYIDSEKLNATLTGNYAKVKDYTCVMKKRERVNGKLQPENRVDIKFRKPFDLYMKWLPGPNQGRELLYRKGKDEKILVHEGGAIIGKVSVRLDLNSSLLKGDTNHRITDTDLGFSLEQIHKNLIAGLQNHDVTLKFLGLKKVGSKDAYVVQSWFKNVQARGYYSAQSVSYHDIATGLPLRTEAYDEKGEMIEYFEWLDMKFNRGLTDADFDPASKAYKF